MLTAFKSTLNKTALFDKMKQKNKNLDNFIYHIKLVDRCVIVHFDYCYRTISEGAVRLVLTLNDRKFFYSAFLFLFLNSKFISLLRFISIIFTFHLACYVYICFFFVLAAFIPPSSTLHRTMHNALCILSNMHGYWFNEPLKIM